MGRVLHREGDDAAADDRRRAGDRRRARLARPVRARSRPRGRRAAARGRTRDRRRPASGARGAAGTTGTRSSASPVRGIDGDELGTVADVYRVGEAEVYVVRGGPAGEFDVPAVRDVHPRSSRRERGEIVVDVDGRSDLEAPSAAVARGDRGGRRRRRRRSRPKATAARRRRRPSASRRAPRRADRECRTTPDAAAMTLEIDVLTLFPAHARGPARGEHPGPDPGAGPGRRSASTTCASGASGGIAASTTHPYGGGAGMVLRPEPVAAALDGAARARTRR